MRLFSWLKQNTNKITRRHKLDSTDGTSLALSQILRRLQAFSRKLDGQLSRVVQPGFVDEYLRKGLIVGLDAAQHDFIYDKSLSNAAHQEMSRLESNREKLHTQLKAIKKDTDHGLARVYALIQSFMGPKHALNDVGFQEIQASLSACMADLVMHKEKAKADIATLTLKHHDAELAYAFLASMDDEVNELRSDLEHQQRLLKASVTA